VQLVTLSHVEDVASMLASVPGNPAAIRQYYNVCSDRQISFVGEFTAVPYCSTALHSRTRRSSSSSSGEKSWMCIETESRMHEPLICSKAAATLLGACFSLLPFS
jgi:hypothetical protein